MSDTIEVQVPFEGFYDSLYSELLDHEDESFVENQRETLDLADEQCTELYELLWRTSSFSTACNALAGDYVARFNECFAEWSGVDLKLSFIEMQSPREYNFTTDRLFAKADLTAICLLRGKVDEAKLAERMEANHKSRSGFISFYSYKLEDWPESVEEWDHNQLNTLIQAFLPEDWRWDVYHDVAEYGYEAWECGVNWEAIDEFLEQFETENEDV